jgi:hypothetical protein
VEPNENQTRFCGRNVTDSDSTPYVVDRPVTIPRAARDTAPGTGFVELVQRKVKKITHTVNASRPFYAVEIPESTEGAFSTPTAPIQQLRPSRRGALVWRMAHGKPS